MTIHVRETQLCSEVHEGFRICEGPLRIFMPALLGEALAVENS
jgi:hypothetical protein